MKELRLAELHIFSSKIEFWAFRRQNNSVILITPNYTINSVNLFS